MAQEIQHFLADVFELEPEIHQHLGSNALLLAQQPQQDVFRADVVVVEISGLLHRVLDDLLGAGCLRQLAHGHHVGTALDQFFDLQADLPQIDVEVLQDVRRNATPLLDQSQQDVFGADVFMVEPLRLLVGQLHDLPGAIGEAFVHCRRSPNQVKLQGLKEAVPAGFFQRRTLVKSPRCPSMYRFVSTELGTCPGHLLDVICLSWMSFA